MHEKKEQNEISTPAKHRLTSSMTPATQVVSDSSVNSASTISHFNKIMEDIITRMPAVDQGEDSDAEKASDNEKQPLLGRSLAKSSKNRTHVENSSTVCDRDSLQDPNRTNPYISDPPVSSHHSIFIYLVTVVSAIGGFLFGYDTGIVSGAMVFIRDYFHLSNFWQEIVVSATIFAAWMFSLVAGYLTNIFGRKWIVVLASAIFTFGGLIMALAPSKEVLLGGRFTVGIAIGLASMVIPVYIAEVAPVQIRGKLVTVNVCFITFGQFVASILAGLFSSDPVHGWRWMLGIASVPSFIQMVVFAFLPESPRWLIQKGHYDAAYKSLNKLRGNTSQREIDAEFDSIKFNCIASQGEEGASNIGRILRTASVRRALFVGSLLMMFQQLAGINTVMYYSASIIKMAGIHDNRTAVWLSALTASINFTLSFVGLALVERLGRRLLLLSSLIGVILALLLLGVGFQLADSNSPSITFHTPNQTICSAMDTCNQCVKSKCGFCFFEGKTDQYHSNGSGSTFSSSFPQWDGSLGRPELNGTCLQVDPHNPLHSASQLLCSNGTTKTVTWANNWCPSNYSWMTLAGLMLYLFFFAPGMGPMPWTITSEIYPLWARGFCCSVSTSFNWFFNLLVSLTFLSLAEALTSHGAYYLYAGLAFIGWLSFYVFLPETKGKTLEEIELLFQRPLMELGSPKNVNYTLTADNDNALNTNNTAVS